MVFVGSRQYIIKFKLVILVVVKSKISTAYIGISNASGRHTVKIFHLHTEKKKLIDFSFRTEIDISRLKFVQLLLR